MYIAYTKQTAPTGRDLQAAMLAVRLKSSGNPWNQRRASKVLVWGHIDRDFAAGTVLRQGVLYNKLSQYRKYQDNGIISPEFTTDKEVAATWGGALARQTLTGHSGQGIEDFVGQDALVYTKYYVKDVEIRVHVWYNRVIAISQKRRKNGVEPSRIRNHANGYIYSDELSNWLDVERVSQMAVQATQALNYSWGGVDIICRQERRDKPYMVLETNAFPGLEGRTVTAYANAALQE